MPSNPTLLVAVSTGPVSYTHLQATDNEDAKKVLSDIRDEEREHMGELLELLERLAPDEKALHDEGRGEVREMLDK